MIVPLTGSKGKREQAVRLVRTALGAGAHTLVMMVGLPQAGKTTAAEAMDAPGLVILDGCNLTQETRQELIDDILPPRVVMVYVETAPDVCRARLEALPEAEQIHPWRFGWMVDSLTAPKAGEADKVIRLSGAG